MEHRRTDDLIYYERADIRKELVIRRLHERGCRMTRQRQILLDIILEQECVSCKEIYYKASAVEPSIGAATVYRLVSLLEDVGAINRRNMYRISCGMDCEEESVCIIQFEDDTFCQLTAQKWHKVILRGLSECGYGAKKRIKNVVVKPCTKTGTY